MRRTARAKVAERCLGIGYQGRPVGAFCRALTEAGVDLLIDVRERAWSHRPEYRKQALARALGEQGIEYVHLKAAGNPFRPRSGESLDFADCARLYAKHLRKHPEIVEELETLLAGRAAALFCYEAERRSCHRSVLMKALARRVSDLELVDL